MMPKEERDRLPGWYNSANWERLKDTCDELEAQIAALKEPMACHFCGNEVHPVARIVADERCLEAHEREAVRLERAATLREAAELAHIPERELIVGKPTLKERILSLIPPADQSALDDLIRKRVAEARLTEARWWRELVREGSDEYSPSKQGDNRLTKLERATAQPAQEGK